MAVLLVQALCPERHCIMAVASEDISAEETCDLLRGHVIQFVESGAINPWCGLCGAQADTWTFEVGRTRFGSVAEAMPDLKQAEAEQLQTNRLLRDAGQAYDPPPGTQN